MTPYQLEKIQTKIKKLKTALSNDKKEWGGEYHDGQGIRYLIPRLYIQIEDYVGGQRYFNWFQKNFPDDSCYPDFLFEWTIINFKLGKLKEAEKKAFKTFCRNTYLFDKFFNRQIKPIEKWEGSNLEQPDFTNYFNYSEKQQQLIDFSQWLDEQIRSEKFIKASNKYIEIQKRLKTENDREIRQYLGKLIDQLENEY
jgi:hypothetical protein